MALIEYKQYNFIYPGAEEPAVREINLTINSGEFVLICGPSGCGKTTLVKQLIPAVAPYGTKEGSIIYSGRDIEEYEDADIAHNFGYVGQNPVNQMITDKVWHELAFGMENLGIKQRTMERRIAEICEFFGMQSWLDRDVATLSGGEMQMVHLAAVMVMEPAVLILDEPTAQLDPLAARNFLDMLKRINSELGTTILLVEHHLEEVYGIADKVVAMNEATVSHIGTPKEVADKLGFKAGLPSSLIIAKALQPEEEDMPLTVAEGQRWMTKWFRRWEDHNDNTNLESEKSREEREDTSPDNIRVDSEDTVTGHELMRKDCSEDEILKIRDIAFAYEDGNIVLEDCSLDVEAGEIFALMGGNGTGKSTLLHILCQTLKQSYGTIEMFGSKVKNIRNAPLGYQGMVYLPQDPMALFTGITVEEELMDALQGAPYDHCTKDNKIAQVLERVGLPEFNKYHPYDLSGGQQQMLALAKMLLLEPRLILMDEPTKGIDYDRKMQLGTMLRELTDQGVTILMVSHDIEFCARYVDRCGLMHDGRVVAVENRREFFAGNKFFTTATNRIARRFTPNAILPEEVIAFCQE